MSDGFDVTIIGAGVIGLAIARGAAEAGLSVCVVEQHESFGKETSSRNSEVIHSGIYYPQDTLKARFCVEGKGLLYALCREHGIPFRNTGKYIVACDEQEIVELEKLRANALRNGVDDLRFVSGEELRREEPNVRAHCGLLCPSTGIIDSHTLMRFYENRAKEKGALFSYNAVLARVDKNARGYDVAIREQGGEFTFQTRTVVNCAGLQADAVAAMVGINTAAADCKLYLCKGDYFNVANRPELSVKRLIYPVPHLASGGLGVHITIDLQGCARLGPDTEYVDRITYDVDPRKNRDFYAAASRYLPALRLEDVTPGMSGMRPKLTRPNEAFRDFYIRHEDDRGLEGFVNLVGMESPGLTSSPAIGSHVTQLLKTILS